MNQPQQGMHHQGLGHGQYGTDPNHTHSHGHMQHSSVSSAASQPSYYYSQHTGMASGLPAYSSSMQHMPVYGGYMNSMSHMTATMPPVSAATSMAGPLIEQPPTSLPTLSSDMPAAAMADTDVHDRKNDTVFDSTGQKQPPGVKPRVTATLWEDEGSLCFQVEADGICVARREDNHMINGTKLLNVAGMTRGRRDGILKSEKTRHVVKIGPMHLKGVWVPFERALEFANKEKILDKLFPLFVHNISALLYNPSTGQSRMSVSAGSVLPTDRRSDESQDPRNAQASQTVGLQHQESTGPAAASSAHVTQSTATNGIVARPEMNRAHTFPTPPTSASSMLGMGTTGGYDWNGPQVPAGSGTQGLQLDTSNRNAYDAGRSYSSHSAHPSYSSSYGGISRYGQIESSPVATRSMAPPARVRNDADDKYNSRINEHPSSDGDHEGDYTHSAGAYGQSRPAYGYSGHSQASIGSDAHISPQMTHSPHKTAGGATPRTTSTYGGYQNQHGQHMPSSNLYGAIPEHRTMPNGSEMYGPPYGSYANKGGQVSASPSSSKKRSAEDDDQMNGAKRQRVAHEHSRPMITQKKR